MIYRSKFNRYLRFWRFLTIQPFFSYLILVFMSSIGTVVGKVVTVITVGNQTLCIFVYNFFDIIIQ